MSNSDITAIVVASFSGVIAIVTAYVRNKRFVRKEELDWLKSQLMLVRMELGDCKKENHVLKEEVKECKQVIESLRSDNLDLMRKLLFHAGNGKEEKS